MPLGEIWPNPRQPRKHLAGLEELAQSLRDKGQLTLVLVRPVGDGYELVHGERRWRAAQLAGFPTVRAEVRELSDAEAYQLAVVENLQREQLSPIEEAAAFLALTEGGMTQAAVGALVGKGQSYVATRIRLLKLPAEVQDAIGAGAITEGHAKQILRLRDAEAQNATCKRAVAEGWSVARLRLEVDSLLAPKAPELIQTPAALTWHLFEQNGGVPQHDPYPEERLPDLFAPPVEVGLLLKTEWINELAATECRLVRDTDYAAWLATIFDTLPPVAVFLIGGAHILADGRYRLAAARLLGRTEVMCRVYEGKTLQDAVAYAIAANSAQGLQLTEADRQRALRTHHRLRGEVVCIAPSASMSRDIPPRALEAEPQGVPAWP